MDKDVYRLLNDQINMELYSAYLYFDIARFFSHEGLDGFENWYRVQSLEEYDHAMRIVDYLEDNGLSVETKSIEKPSWEKDGLMRPLEVALEHEKKITASIDCIYAHASKSKDFRTMTFLNWFVDEQREEERNANNMISRMRLFDTDSKTLYLVNRELKERKRTAPSP